MNKLKMPNLEKKLHEHNEKLKNKLHEGHESAHKEMNEIEKGLNQKRRNKQ